MRDLKNRIQIRQWTKRLAASFAVVVWLIVACAWLRSYRTQDVIEWPMAGRLLRVHVQRPGVMFTMVSGWPLRDGSLWQSRGTDESYSGIPVKLTSPRPGLAVQLLIEPLLPGLLRHRGSGVTDGVGSQHLDETRSGRLPGVRATGSGGTVSWLWLLGLLTLAAGAF